jgi:Ran GTPase-activating protein (RanGAP) involved in mRNA processing and transport
MEEMSLVKACERLESGDDTLRGLRLDDVDARLVRALGRPSCLESFSLYNVELDRHLADALAKQTQLTSLQLYNLRLGAGTASYLAAALREMARLETVRFSVREVSEGDVKCVLAAVGELPQLQTLGLSGRAFGSVLKTLIKAVVDRGWLRELDLYNSPVGDDGAVHLAAMLERNRSLSVLTISRCSIGDAGLDRLGKALTHNTTLRKLDVRHNNFTAEGVACFAGMMGDMHGLQVLYLEHKWEEQLLLGIKRNYSLLQLYPPLPAFQPFLARNARGYDKAHAATLAWLCCCRFHPPKGITRDIGLIIARHIYASRGRSCWVDDSDAMDDSK